jgi:hypothetical protein
MIRVARAVRWMPRRFSAVTATTAATASGRAACGQAYAPKVRAIAAQLAVLPTTNPCAPPRHT